jgi:hypothetical protein
MSEVECSQATVENQALHLTLIQVVVTQIGNQIAGVAQVVTRSRR